MLKHEIYYQNTQNKNTFNHIDVFFCEQQWCFLLPKKTAVNDNKTRQQIDIVFFSLFVVCQIHLNTFILGTAGKLHLLHDQTITEKEKAASDVSNVNNEVNNKKSGTLNLTDLYLLKQNSMAVYYGWQLVCLIIFIFAAYETLQNV